MKKYLVEYFSNNSGGIDWLEKKDWDNLEKNGWKLFEFDSFLYEDGNYIFGEDGLPTYKKDIISNPTYAFKRFDDITEALQEFESITGKDISAEGCNCCGAPHCFSWKPSFEEENYCSGEDCLKFLFPGKNIPRSIREAIE